MLGGKYVDMDVITLFLGVAVTTKKMFSALVTEAPLCDAFRMNYITKIMNRQSASPP
jgi:hypothetical protein